jgi:hypothetical protein
MLASGCEIGNNSAVVAVRARRKTRTNHGYVAGIFAGVCWAASTTCVPDGAQRGHGSAAGRNQPPPLDLTHERPWPASYSADPLWVRASTGNDIDQARLAIRESAQTLAVALGHGGSLGRTALTSLAYASDRHEVRGQLCALVRGTSAWTLSSLLTSIHEIVTAAPVTEESVDSQSDARCTHALQEVAQMKEASPADRDQAQSAMATLQRQ